MADTVERMARAAMHGECVANVRTLEVPQPNELVAPGELVAGLLLKDSTYRAFVNVPADPIGSSCARA